jgi:hypothetical protein
MGENITVLSLQWLLLDLLKIFPAEKLMENKQNISLMLQNLKNNFGESEVNNEFLAAFFGSLNLINEAGGFRQLYGFLLEAKEMGLLTKLGEYTPPPAPTNPFLG